MKFSSKQGSSGTHMNSFHRMSTMPIPAKPDMSKERRSGFGNGFASSPIKHQRPRHASVLLQDQGSEARTASERRDRRPVRNPPARGQEGPIPLPAMLEDRAALRLPKLCRLPDPRTRDPVLRVSARPEPVQVPERGLSADNRRSWHDRSASGASRCKAAISSRPWPRGGRATPRS